MHQENAYWYGETVSGGLLGGINSHAYVEGDPVSWSDPTGLATYMCTQPLHGLGPTLGPLLYSPKTNQFHHKFIATMKSDGTIITGGQDRSNGIFSPGKPSEGDGAPGSGASCEKVADDNECLESCLNPQLTSSARPNYALKLGSLYGAQNCQQWADSTLASCVAKCSGKK